jgi:glycerophosphoryl diester phosphodiesterase
MKQPAVLSACALSLLCVSVLAQEHHVPLARKRLVAHRGASAYAPEHTAAAYTLAITQQADYVEQDLAVTKDGVLVCLHDDSLERTTDVEQMFPERYTIDPSGQRRWLVVDFTLAEIKQLDAGSWFSPAFAGERILTWDEAVALVGDKAGLYPELKSPPLYRARGIDMTALFVASLGRLGLADAPASRMIVQSFDPQALQELAKAAPRLARTFLVESRDASRWFTAAGMAQVAAFASDVSPNKQILDRHPELVDLAHAAGLTVTPYTFTTRAAGRIADVQDEMKYYLQDLGVDALFTDNPDRFPR